MIDHDTNAREEVMLCVQRPPTIKRHARVENEYRSRPNAVVSF
jgi:hypothetical protein